MLASPCATPVAIPELLMVTTVLALDAQATWDVQSPLVPSEYWQVAAATREGTLDNLLSIA
jgi:hypothetical protein